MATSHDRFQLVTDTGANAAITSDRNFGVITGLAYKAADTGVRADTGAVITLTADAGDFNIPLFVTHLLPNGASWYHPFAQQTYDTGGGIITGSFSPYVFNGEKVTASIQGIATDTGKSVDLKLYWLD